MLSCHPVSATNRPAIGSRSSDVVTLTPVLRYAPDSPAPKIWERGLGVILNHGVPMDAELRAAVTDLTEAVESSLSLDQKLELALPLVPFLLNYKIELGAGSEVDLHDVADDLGRHWRRLLAKRG